MSKYIWAVNNVFILSAGKRLGAPTGNVVYDSLKNITGLLSLAIIFLALMNPRLYKDARLKKHSRKILRMEYGESNGNL